MADPIKVALIPRRDSLVAAAGLLGVTLLAWTYVLSGAGLDMPMPDMVMAPMAWTPATALLMFAMWWVMMIAMMVPSATPTILLFATISRKGSASANSAFGTCAFLAGYLAAWAGFSLLATAVQWALDQLGLMAMDMSANSRLLASLTLLAAGFYQFAPGKTRCLEHCRNPILFFGGHWRSGPGGALRMGARHGAYCLGCCWLLMLLLFVGGIMNLLWIAGLAVYVGLEKLGIAGRWLGRLAGLLLSGSGILLLSGAV